MQRIKCFLLEKTDKTFTKPCSRPGCDHKDECFDFKSPIYRRPDTGEEGIISSFPAGAMYYADWMEGHPEYAGPDGKTLYCKVPDGKGTHSWCIDGKAANCTKKEDWVHRCWCRHGSPPNITVDKSGNTCSAGAGSILTDGWHGFLRNGYLESC